LALAGLNDKLDSVLSMLHSFCAPPQHLGLPEGVELPLQTMEQLEELERLLEDEEKSKQLVRLVSFECIFINRLQ
jgi:hypothetical protein